MILSERLQQINLLNETKGQELIVLNQLPDFRQAATTEQDWNMVAQSFWQEHLAHQHLVMNDQDPDGLHRSAMLTTAQSGHQIVVDHQLTSLLGASHRFLGRAYTYQDQHHLAKIEYQTAIDLLKKDQDPRYLEVTGFLCETLIRSGQPNTGLDLAYQIYDLYDTDPLAQLLKQTDEYKFNVWRSGIFPRLVTALNELNIDYSRSKVKEYLQKSQQSLIDKDKYAYRLSEIQKSLALLGSFIFTVFNLTIQK